MKGEWIRKPIEKAAIIFVHGFLSDGESCWRHENGFYWPKLINNEKKLEDIGVYVFSYQTNIFSGNYRLSDVVDMFKEQMQLDNVFKNKQLIFVCHSMGGIVVRKFLVERASELIENQVMIGLFLVASPSLGSFYADWLFPLAKFLGHSQAKVLGFIQGNEWLMDLDKEFTNLKESKRIIIIGKEIIEDKFIVLKGFLRQQVVESFSGARYFGEPLKIPGSDHFSIAKPENNMAIQHRLLVQFIESNFKPFGLDSLAFMTQKNLNKTKRINEESKNTTLGGNVYNIRLGNDAQQIAIGENITQVHMGEKHTLPDANK